MKHIIKKILLWVFPEKDQRIYQVKVEHCAPYYRWTFLDETIVGEKNAKCAMKAAIKLAESRTSGDHPIQTQMILIQK